MSNPDINSQTHPAVSYGFTELPGTTGHRNFILTALLDRYTEQRDKEAYVIIMHRLDVEHYIMGVYDDLREACQTRFVCNSILLGANQLQQKNHMGVHHISGPSIEDQVFDPKTNTIVPAKQKSEDE